MPDISLTGNGKPDMAAFGLADFCVPISMMCIVQNWCGDFDYEWLTLDPYLYLNLLL